ncbi:MAG TPA: VWA domain-containing protein [Magnetospirillaceae bacterium]|jgi:hypothetical protein
MTSIDPSQGHLLDNLMHFARTLRAAGLRVGPGDVVIAAQAVEAVTIERRDDLHTALASVFVKRRQDREVFDEAFHIFWRNPELIRKFMSLLLPSIKVPTGESPEQQMRRLQEALGPNREPGEAEGDAPEDFDSEIALQWSDREKLGQRDFEQMTAEEYGRARAIVSAMRLPIAEVRTRRREPSAVGGRIDPRATLRAGLRTGSGMILPKFTAPKSKPPPVVVLCDISGSMEPYARIFLHFMHGLANGKRRFHGFVFGTRLTNLTRTLKNRDPDVALANVSKSVQDWSGGTRIGRCLGEFNRLWSRRVLTQGPLVLMMTDGLDQAPDETLGREMERLHKSCRRLVWLNPLLRWDGFEPRAAGIKAMMPHVDEFRPVHNLDSLEALAEALARETQSHRLEASARPRFLDTAATAPGTI